MIKRNLGAKGFSLVELMVVVAIIGILAAVAIPNFQRFQRKAKQSEATAQLGALHGVETAFHGQWEQYTGDIYAAGFSPDGQLRYNVNLPAVAWSSGAQSPDFTGQALLTTRNTSASICAITTKCMDLTGGAMGAVAPTLGGIGDMASFLANAASTAALIGGMNADEWTIDHLKVMMNTTDGTL